MSPATVLAFPQQAKRFRDAIAIQLPMPVSTNNLWASNSKGLYKTAAYRRWITEAGLTLAAQRPGAIDGPYHLWIDIERPKGKRHCDLGNLEKSVSDLLQAHGVVKNDKLADSIILSWSDDPEREGCLVSLKKAERETVWG